MHVFRPSWLVLLSSQQKLRWTLMKNLKEEKGSHLRMKSLAPSISSTVLLVRGRWAAPSQERTMVLTMRRRKVRLLVGVAISKEVDGDTDQSGSGIKRADWSSPTNPLL